MKKVKMTKRINSFLLMALTAVLAILLTITGVRADNVIANANPKDDGSAVSISVKTEKAYKNIKVQIYHSDEDISKATWHELTYTGSDNLWSAVIPADKFSNEKTGEFYYCVWGIAGEDTDEYLTKGMFELKDLPLSVTGSDANGVKNTFKVTVAGLEKSKNVSKVKLEVTAGNKAAYTYTPSLQKDGTYQTEVKLSNHKYYWGKYSLKATISLEDGKTRTVSGEYNFDPQNYYRIGKGNDDKSRTFYASNLTVKGSKVTVELWSKTNGRDDVTTYTMKKEGRLYKVVVNLTKLKHEGIAYFRVKVDGKQCGADFEYKIPANVVKKNGWYYEKYNGTTYKFYYENGVKRKDVSSLIKNKKYMIELNRAACVATVLAYDSQKKTYCIPVKAFTVSVGSDVSSTKTSKGLTLKSRFTPLGTYSVCSNGKAVRYSMKTMVEPDKSRVYARWATHLVGNVYFHAIAVSKNSHKALNYKTYNKLGSPAAAGCIRMTVADAKWIYDNIKTGTKVKIIKGSKNTPGPLGKPATIRIKSSKVKYDPTDPAISDSTKQKDYKAGRITGYMKKNGTKVGY